MSHVRHALAELFSRHSFDTHADQAMTLARAGRRAEMARCRARHPAGTALASVTHLDSHRH